MQIKIITFYVIDYGFFFLNCILITNFNKTVKEVIHL